MEDKELEYYTSNPDLLPEYSQQDNEHPTPAQLLFRMAVDHALMRDQKKIWQWHNYDKLTDTEIAKKLKVSRSAITQRLKVIKGLLIKYCREHMETYKVLKDAEDSEPNGC